MPRYRHLVPANPLSCVLSRCLRTPTPTRAHTYLSASAPVHLSPRDVQRLERHLKQVLPPKYERTEWQAPKSSSGGRRAERDFETSRRLAKPHTATSGCSGGTSDIVQHTKHTQRAPGTPPCVGKPLCSLSKVGFACRMQRSICSCVCLRRSLMQLIGFAELPHLHSSAESQSGCETSLTYNPCTSYPSDVKEPLVESSKSLFLTLFADHCDSVTLPKPREEDRSSASVGYFGVTWQNASVGDGRLSCTSLPLHPIAIVIHDAAGRALRTAVHTLCSRNLVLHRQCQSSKVPCASQTAIQTSGRATQSCSSDN